MNVKHTPTNSAFSILGFQFRLIQQNAWVNNYSYIGSCVLRETWKFSGLFCNPPKDTLEDQMLFTDRKYVRETVSF